MSDKFKVIDHATFERMQETSRNVSESIAPKIRNAKYKRAAANSEFNLFKFIKKDQERCGSGGTKKSKHKIRKRVMDDRFKPSIKRKGKQREGGRKGKPTSLKKSILRYRQMKRDQDKRQESLTTELQELTLVRDRNVATGDGKSGLHSSRFRDYCENCTSPVLKQHTEHLLRELNRFQRRAYAQNEIKARAHRRFVVGFREVQNFLRINKVKLVIIATDCEGDAGLDQTISIIKTLCHDQQVPISFPFQRRQLAYFLYKKASVSCIGILDYDGARDDFLQLIVALKDARESYKQLVQKYIS